MNNTLKETMSSYPLTIRPEDALDLAHGNVETGEIAQAVADEDTVE